MYPNVSTHSWPLAWIVSTLIRHGMSVGTRISLPGYDSEYVICPVVGLNAPNVHDSPLPIGSNVKIADTVLHPANTSPGDTVKTPPAADCPQATTGPMLPPMDTLGHAQSPPPPLDELVTDEDEEEAIVPVYDAVTSAVVNVTLFGVKDRLGVT